MKCWGVVPAAGRGARMNGGVPKQYRMLGGVSVLDRSIAALLAHPAMQAVMVALSARDDRWSESRCAGDARVLSCTGGGSRAESVHNALEALAGIADDDDWVAVHDAVRPCLRGADLARLLSEAADEPAGAVLVAPISDTVKQVAGGYIERTLDRGCVVRAVTPQVFRYRLLREALAGALADGVAPTDEAAAMERAGHPVRAVAGDAGNVKITWPGDLRRAESNLETGDTQ
ncbi:MAG: 2-C-methyl-D-erythritol 4-phosphate cytidylyltransferase [Gammaproteobacteria bacterium]|nr:2-C-methyl-D-erythritol 4-phosphate cytidylyltransferase [Gammaproteobacteria bacterium]